MNYKLIISYLLVQISLFGFAQQKTEKVETIFGKEVKASRYITLDYIIGEDDTGGIYVLKRKLLRRNFALIEHYDSKMNLVNSEELELKYQKKDLDLERVIKLDNEFFILSSFKNNKQKKNYLFIQKLNKKTLQPTGNLKKLAEIDFESKSKRNAGYFDYSFSPDEKKMLIFYSLPLDKGSNEKVGLHVYDAEMEELWANEITIPFEDKLFSITDYEVSDNGDVFILGKRYKEKLKETRKGNPNYDYYIISYTHKTNSLDKLLISIESKYLRNMRIAINDNNEIICGGFYSNKDLKINVTRGTVSRGIKGSYFLRINTESKEIQSKSFKEFDIDFITENMSKRAEKKAKKKDAKGKNVELAQYDLRNFVLRDDGGVVLIGEQYYTYTSSYTDANGNFRSSTTYVYNDIIVVNINPEGEIEWAEKIAKRQSSTNDGGMHSSFALGVVDDKLYFIYNDNLKNLLITNRKEKIHNFTFRKNAVVTLVEMDSDGKYVKDVLFSGDRSDIYIRPKVSRQVDDKELIIFGQRKKKQGFAKVTFLD